MLVVWRRSRWQQAPQALELESLLDAEDRAHDHLERHRLHRRQQRELVAGAPRVDLAPRGLLHDLLVAAHALAVEGGQHHPALAQVVGLVEQQDRARADDRLERGVGVAGVHQLGAAGEDRAHVLGIAEEDERLAVEVQREDVTEALALACGELAGRATH